jgi:hypothetical protein
MAKVTDTKSKVAPDTKAASLANAEASQNKAAASKKSSTGSKSKSAAAKNADKAGAVGQPKTSFNSSVTTDVPSQAGSTAAATRTLTEADEAALDAINRDPMQRAMDAGIGLIKPFGFDFDYVGVTPSRDRIRNA